MSTTTKPAEKTERKLVDFSTLDCVNVTYRRPAKWYMFVAKQVLKFKEQIDIKARPMAAAQVVRVAEALKRLGYITYVKYQTTTTIKEDRLQRFIIITVKKTANFDKLFKESEEARAKKIEERNKNAEKK